MKIFVIAVAGARDGVEKTRNVVSRLRSDGHSVAPRLVLERGDAARFVTEALAADAELVIAGGGDGTVHEVVNTMYAARPEHELPRLAVLPMGTGNDLAHAIGLLPGDLNDAVDVALGGEVQPVDVGVVNDECFLNVSTGGFAAEATEESPQEVKRALGGLAYLVAGARKVVGLEASDARFSTARGEEIMNGRFLLFAVGNSRRTGGGNWITPRASMTDGLLDLCIIHEIPRVELIRLMPDLRGGRHLEHPAVTYRQVPDVIVESAAELSVNADGEPMRGDRFEYRVGVRRIPLMIPRRKS